MVTVKIDAKQAQLLLAGAEKQIPWALAVAINRTAEDALAVMRKELPTRFTFREPNLLNLVAPKILMGRKRASPRRLTAILDTETRAAKLFTDFEDGRPKVASAWQGAVAIPTRWTRTAKGTRIPAKDWPANMGLSPKYVALRPSARTKAVVLSAANGYAWILARGKAYKQGRADGKFVMGKPGMKAWGVWQRKPDTKELVKLFHFRPSNRRPPILQWVRTMEPVVLSRWGTNMRGAAEAALRIAQRRRA